MSVLVIGSRGSQLALWQSRWVQARLAELGQESRIEVIHTTGDKVLDVALSMVGSKGLFTKEIEDALLRGEIDLAVHSLKDMPTLLPDGLALAAIPAREDPRDALVGSTLVEIPEGARVGTSSLRRAAQLRHLRPDLNVQTIRGNVDTRLRKLDEGQFDVIVLASAGLRRLGWEHRIAESLDPSVMCPAVGQGALAIETRVGDSICQQLDNAPTRICVMAERSLLATLGGGCQVPIGAHARLEGDSLHLLGVIVAPDGSRVIRLETQGPAAKGETLGAELGASLLAAGGQGILELVHGQMI